MFHSDWGKSAKCIFSLGWAKLAAFFLLSLSHTHTKGSLFWQWHPDLSRLVERRKVALTEKEGKSGISRKK